MPILKIDSCKTSKSGKSLNVSSNGKWYLAKLDSGLDKIVGQSIDCETEDSEFNGATMTWINKYRVTQQTVPASAPASSGGNIMPFMPFVSNTVAHALLAGKIESPADISKWAEGAYEAAIALESIAEFRSEL